MGIYFDKHPPPVYSIILKLVYPLRLLCRKNDQNNVYHYLMLANG